MAEGRSHFKPYGGFGRTHFGDHNSDDGMDSVGSNDIDIDFSITESGRTVAHLIAGMKDDDQSAIMDLSITTSGRTVTSDVAPACIEENNNKASKPKPIPQRTVPNGNTASSSLGTFLQPSSQESSGSAFISGIMSKDSMIATLSHTPPHSSQGTSYEARHFGKRPRSGSVSGRLRSASDLEDKGIIDRHQKGVLKDLIISGDDALQDALDRYEKGDISELEGMIKSGALANRTQTDIDLLGDLDMDFLTVDDMEDRTYPQHLGTRIDNTANASVSSVTPSIVGDDGIGEMDFNGDFGGVQFNLRKQALSFDVEGRKSSFDSRSRSRTNSLAYGILQNEDQPNEEHQDWMDYPSSSDGIRIRKTTPAPLPEGTGGLAACLAEYAQSQVAKEKTEKAQKAQDKRRERQLKKEKKAQEKLEQKQRKEQERKEKRQAKEREKRQAKEREKSHAERRGGSKKEADMEVEEKVVVSGTGRPRSMSDPNLKSTLDENGLLHVERPEGWVGAYSPESRKIRIERFMEKRNHRVWKKSVKYDVRKNFADSRLRVKGRFVRKEDELLMRELMSLT